jgi:hypothetical protein
VFSSSEKKIAERLKQKGYYPMLKLGRISMVSASGHVTDSDVSVLISCRYLTYLDLQQSRITDDAMIYIGNLASLKRLHLGYTCISAKGLAHLRNLKRLRSLDLTGTSIVIDDALEYLEVMSSLRWLDLRSTPKTEASPSAIERLKNRNPNLEFHPAGLPVIEDR